jgi:ABC-type glutathione transport system ATPase component
MAPQTIAAGEAATTLLEVKDLSKRYIQRRALSRAKFFVDALRGVSLEVRRGTTVAVIGESGSGKSTLARCLALLETADRGEITFDGCDLLQVSARERFALCRRIQLIFQDPTSALNPRLTAAALIAEPLAIQRIGTKEERRRKVRELMERVGLPARWETKRPLEFSGGQRQRIAIARALVLGPRLLILDEALSSLDLANQRSILALLADLQSSTGLTYLHISHDLRLVSDLSDEIVVMHAGKIVEHKTAPGRLVHAGNVGASSALGGLRSGEATATQDRPKVLA